MVRSAQGKNEIDVITVRSQFGQFADWPSMPHGFIVQTMNIVIAANNPKHPLYEACRQHVEDAITAATQPFPAAGLAVPNLYYWPTGGHRSPGPGTRPYLTIQGNTFYTQDNIPTG